MANYGDLTLNLPPDWSRQKEHDQNYAIGMVGHENGVADAYLEDAPDTQHQFAWVDTRYRDEIDINRHKGYEFVKQSDGWVKNNRLWDWDAEGFCVLRGQRLMARSKESFLADMDARRKQRNKVMGKNKDDDEARQIAARAGIALLEEDDDRPRGMRNR